jgi:hypothetical protein
MKVSKEGNKVITEVEESDIPAGQTMEMAVDALFCSAKTLENRHRTSPSFSDRVIDGDPAALKELAQMRKNVHQEFNERWEILPG